MFYTTEKLLKASGCRTDDGLRMWLMAAGIPYSENGQGRPQVMAQFAHMVDRAGDAIGQALAGVQTIRRRESAVYMLKLKGVVVYVGMSNAMLSRLGNHCAGSLKFDEIDVIQVPAKFARLLETELIARHLPKLNKKKVPRSANPPPPFSVPMRIEDGIPVFCGKGIKRKMASMLDSAPVSGTSE